MKKQIWKFPASILDKVTILMPKRAEILALQTQHDDPYIWALVDPKAEKEERCFELYGTGHDILCNEDIKRKYIGTFQIRQGKLVFHMFEIIK